MSPTLHQRFQQLCTPFTADEEQVLNWWLDLAQHYTQPTRHYHNLLHLENMFAQLEQCSLTIEDRVVLQFSIFYHDVIYVATRQNNELESAAFAQSVLQQMDIDPLRIQRCFRQIVLTQKHQASAEDSLDEQLLLDFDLDILSSDRNTYELYTQQIRKEYSWYPNFIYRKGRKKAMQQFLQRPFIYHTDNYRKEKEQLARENIKWEMGQL